MHALLAKQTGALIVYIFHMCRENSLGNFKLKLHAAGVLGVLYMIWYECELSL